VIPIVELVGYLGIALLTAWAFFWISRAVRRARRARRDVGRVRQVAQAFDVNPADADVLADVSLLGSPRNPSTATTDRHTFDAGSALYLTQILLSGGDLWGAVLALSRLRRRFGFEEAGDSASLAPFLGRVLVIPPGTKEPLDGVVIDRRGGLRVVLATPADGRIVRGATLEVRNPDGNAAAQLAVFAIEPAGAGISLTLGSPTREAPQSRLPTMLPALLRRVREGDEETPEEATILDLSHGGACVRVPHSAREGEKVRMTFEAGSAGSVDVEATVVWSAPAGGGRWRTGVRFGDMPETSREAILAFLTPAETEKRRSVASGVGP